MKKMNAFMGIERWVIKHASGLSLPALAVNFRGGGVSLARRSAEAQTGHA